MTEPLAPPAEGFSGKENPWDLPRFDRFAVDRVEPDVAELLTNAEEGFAKIEREVAPTYAATVTAADRLFEPFERVWGPVGHLMGVQNSPELRAAQAAAQPKIVRFGLKTAQSRPIYEALVALRDGAEWEKLSSVQRRIVSHKILSAELAGVALEGEKKERFNALAEEASKLSTEFSNHVLDATKAFSLTLTDPAEVDGVPQTARRLFAAAHNEAKGRTASENDEPEATPENGPWRVTLDGPAMIPFLQHATRRDLRERVYRAHVTKASGAGESPEEDDNTPLVGRILAIRQKIAELLGYPHYAAVSLAEKMAPDVVAVEKLHADLLGAAKDGAAEDMADLKPLAERYGLDEIRHWDVAFLAERLREERFEFTDEDLRPYFALPNVLEGLFSLCRRLFGVTVEHADGEAPVWHPDARFFRLRLSSEGDEAGETIAGFYLDPYSRPADKRGGAWMGDCLGRRRNADGSLQLPVAYLICNGTPPTGDTPSLMSFREVETLFHEFGHGLQHMLTTVEEPGAAGISGVEWDAVELPSQFMENWCYHRPTLMGFAKHHETGEPLPDELFEKIVKARTFRAGSQMCRQIGFGSSDMKLHSSPEIAGDADAALELHRETLTATAVLPPLGEDRTLCSFSHIFAGGYAAGYYSYKWAEVLSADAFAAFEEAGLDDEAAVERTGRRFRDTVLSLGGGEDPMGVFERFRGRPPQPDALLRHSGLKSAE